LKRKGKDRIMDLELTGSRRLELDENGFGGVTIDWRQIMALNLLI